MEHPLNPSSPSIFFLFLLFFIMSFNNIPPSLTVDLFFTNCSHTFNCGKISNLKYPFWGGNTTEYCGLPDFQLKCESNIPKITIQSLTYQILDLNSTSQTLTLVRDDYFNTLCPLEYKNNTFDPNTFKFVDGVVNVTLLYDCDDNFPKDQYVGQSCKRNDNTYVYYVLGLNYNGNCKSRVIMPVFESKAVLANQIPSAIENGFGLQWKVNNEVCNTCSESGGQCGYTRVTGQLCFCREGPRNISCSEGSSPVAESSKKPSLRLKIAIGVSAGVAALIVMSILIICNHKRGFRIQGRKIIKETRAYHNHHHNLETFMKNYGSMAPKQYSYSEVKKMTKSFSEKLGQGGYGVVYKGSLPDGRLAAMKVISISKGSGEEFLNEVASISRTSHINIVTLLGFCYERKKQVLIYQYMPNGSLDKFLYKGESSGVFCALEWKVLYKIAIGIARGLEYLHRGCNTRIVHFDIKPQNILLDEDFCPKISDFGLAKLCQKKESIVSILGTRGTIGFIAPEIFSRAFGGVSHKSDVYSYGMLVLEMVGGRKNYDNGESQIEEMYFPDWIYKDLEKGNVDDSSDYLSIKEEESEVIRKMTYVSLWCIQTNPSERPAMNKVVEMLEGPIQSLTFPPKPSLNSPAISGFQFSDLCSSAILDTNSTNTLKDASTE